MRIRPLAATDRVEDFACGDQGLDRFLKRFGLRNQAEHHIGVTYLLTDDGDSPLGYITLASGSLQPEDAPTHASGLPRHPLPIVRIARLAIDGASHRHGFGTLLVRFACDVALVQAGKTGCVGLVVDALPEAVGFYGRLGFEPLDVVQGGTAARPSPVPMFLPITEILRAVAGRF